MLVKRDNQVGKNVFAILVDECCEIVIKKEFLLFLSGIFL